MKKETLKCPECGHDQFGMVRQCRGNWYQGVKFIGSTYEVEDGQWPNYAWQTTMKHKNLTGISELKTASSK